MRVLLIKSRSLVSKNMGTSPPLGVMYLASYLRRHNAAQVRIVDLKLLSRPLEQVREILKVFRPQLVGLSALTVEAHVALKIARLVKQADPQVPVIIGGPHATVATAAALESGHVDAAVLGEGEETISELVRLIQDEGAGWKAPARLRQVRGVAFKDADGRVTLSEPRPPIEDLDALPFPAWDLIDYRAFGRIPGMASIGVRPYMSIFTSRGCPYGCVYCQHMFGRRFRARSVESVVAEIRQIWQQLGIPEVEVVDDISNFDTDRLNRILEELLRQGLHMRFSFPNGVRTDLLQGETIRLLKQVGVGEVSVAVETASARLQKMLHKNLDLDKVWNNIERMARLRIPMRGFFMLGFPSETREELLSTVDFACRSRLHLALFFTVNPHQDTELYRLFKQYGKLPQEVETIDYEYYGAPFNGSELSDEAFQRLYKRAYLRFYTNPVRLYRIARDRPQYRDIPRRMYGLVRNITSFRRLDEVV